MMMYITSKEFGIRCPFWFFVCFATVVFDVKSSQVPHNSFLFFCFFFCRRLSIFPTWQPVAIGKALRLYVHVND